MDLAALYPSLRPLLFALAYRMLGSMAEAEDIVQETFLDLSRHEAPETIDNPKGYACKIASNKCGARLQRLIREREAYIGPWLPEPLVEYGTDPSSDYMHRESLATAYLLLLQQLSETERLVFVLKEVLQFSYREIAYITEKSEANCRQIGHRARLAMQQHTGEAPMASEQMGPLIEQFVQALQTGDIQQLLRVLDDKVVLTGDSGGQVPGSRVPVASAERVAAFLMKTNTLVPADAKTSFVPVNGLPGVVLSSGGRVMYVFSFHAVHGRIAGIYAVANPDKLSRLQA
ncbi:RNA polymerase sigma factor SigJ [Paenibacillus daejeonensis]|uniref:RNA polymerase sigma factor SigJ n=1 Tax=Paenibacillus daejeonensis TaxID=135193 RepID=UPI0003601A74|nr:RNA polymerase sigma factor SigJ [Paenibacillus daejeonensis]